MGTYEELYCRNCGAPLSTEEMADNKNEICDACKEEEVGKQSGG
jgi:NAD-dependent SIR2 family protein deacetylase